MQYTHLRVRCNTFKHETLGVVFAVDHHTKLNWIEFVIAVDQFKHVVVVVVVVPHNTLADGRF